MKITLKPCPFCGGKAELITGRTELGAVTRALVSCTECEASIAPFYDDDHDGQFVFSAIDAWNKRSGVFELEVGR